MAEAVAEPRRRGEGVGTADLGRGHRADEGQPCAS